jgi:hypothetical protein
MTPLLLLPWTPAMAYGAWREWTDRERVLDRRVVRLFLSWFGVGFLVLCCSQFQHKHYLIPLLPPFAVVGAIGLERLIGQSQWSWPGLAARGAALFTAIGLGRDCWLANRWPAGRLAALFTFLWLGAVGVQCLAMPNFDSYRDQAAFARRINGLIGDAPLFLVGLPENQITYYLRPPLVRVDDPSELPARLAGCTGHLFVLAPHRYYEHLARLGPVHEVDRCDSIRKIMAIPDRLTLFCVIPTVPPIVAATTQDSKEIR